MDNDFQTVAGPLRREPDPEVIRAAIQRDPAITRLQERHSARERDRIAAVRATLEPESRSLDEWEKQRRELTRKISAARQRISRLKKQLSARPLAKRDRATIEKRKQRIRIRERERFLRSWKIEFDRATRSV